MVSYGTPSWNSAEITDFSDHWEAKPKERDFKRRSCSKSRSFSLNLIPLKIHQKPSETPWLCLGSIITSHLILWGHRGPCRGHCRKAFGGEPLAEWTCLRKKRDTPVPSIGSSLVSGKFLPWYTPGQVSIEPREVWKPDGAKETKTQSEVHVAAHGLRHVFFLVLTML